MKLEPIYYDCASHALRHVKGVTPEMVQELAEHIQEICQETAAEIAGEDTDDDDI